MRLEPIVTDSYSLGATPDSYSYLKMTSAILSGLAPHHTVSYSYGTKPYRLVFVSRDDVSNTGGVGTTPYGPVFIVSAILSGLALHLSVSYVFGATP